MIKSLLIIFYTVFLVQVQAQTKTENVVIVTMDGLRWQEVFSGADSLLTFDTTANYSINYVQKNFWLSSADERRKKLMPFLWSSIVNKGVIMGNRNYGNKVNNSNPYWFSYPGYNEIFTGYPDTSINSNDKIPNKNENVFEYLNRLPAYKGRIAVFASWDVFSYIFNEKRSGILVNDGFKNVQGKLTERQKVFNQLQHEMPDLFHGGERLDAATFNMGFEYMKVNKPRLMYFGLGDADEFAHAGQYDYYLDAASKLDSWLKKLWDYIQATPEYANKTTLLIATDHGRGSAFEGNWKHHGSKIEGASEIWMAAIGPSVKAVGENKQNVQLYQGQIATTIADLLGKNFKPNHPVMPPLQLGK